MMERTMALTTGHPGPVPMRAVPAGHRAQLITDQ
jgi:hypothetical protein